MITCTFPSRKHLRSVVWIGLGVLVGVLVFAAGRPAHATGACTRTPAVCDATNPAGGPLLRGLLWLAQVSLTRCLRCPLSRRGSPATDGRALFESSPVQAATA
jgi:hypothetical protein